MKTNNAWKKRFVAGAAFLACVGAALTLEASVTISSLTPATGAEVTNGVSMTVTALLTTNDGSVVQSVELAYAWNGGDWNTQAMTAVSGTNYTATIPPAVSSLAFYVTCRTGTTSVAISATNAVSTTLPDYVRYADFEVTNAVAMDYAWRQTPGTTNWVYTIGTNSWTANQCRMPSPIVNNCPPGGTNRVIQLLSKQGGASYVQTPVLAEGVGTIYYTSLMSDPGYSAQMIIQVTTNSSPGNWQDVWTNNYNNYPGTPIEGVKTTNAIPIVLNNPAVRYVRFWRTDNGKNNSGNVPIFTTLGSIYIDNIAVSRPPTDVTITQLLQNPGYPSQDQDVTVRCQVNDVDTNVPSVNRRVTVTHSWGQTNLVSMGGGLYEGVISRHGVGTNSYSFACVFDGYAYSRDPDGPAGSQTNRNERIGRAQLGSFEYGVRSFRSDVQVMQVVTNPAGAAVNMDLVGDHVWQWALTNAASSTLNWTFAGLWGYTNNATVYDPTSWKWGETNQPSSSIPINGFAERDATNAIAATGISSNLVIRLNRQTGEYIATADRLALWNIAPLSGSPVAIGRAFTVGADISPLIPGSVEIVSVWLVYSWGGGAAITNRMSMTSTNRYEGVVPRLPVGALTNYVLTLYSIGGVTNSIQSQPIGYTLTDALDASRFTDFRTGTWTPENATQTNYAYLVGVATSTWWVAEMGKYPVTDGAALPPGSVSPAFGIRAQTNAFLQSPCLTNGVGTVYFTSVMGEPNRYGEVAVQYTTDSVPGNWQTATTLVYAASSGYRATNSAPVTLNNSAVRYVRFVRQDSIVGLDVGLIYFDNIYLSPPPTQVTITESLYNPGYPASNQAVTVRCRVADVDAGNPSTNRLVHVHYRWNTNSGSWTTNNMVLTNGVYESTIPQLGAGTNYYYFTCDYDGYFYTHDPDGAGPQPSYQEVSAVNPAYLGRDAAPLSYAIRPFRSDVSVMQVVTNVSAPASVVPMELVSNHLWRVRMPLQGITNLSWTFAGVDGYTNDAASYAAASWVWGATNPASAVLPITNGVAVRDSATNIVITGLPHGLLTIEMNGTNGRYSVVTEPYVTPGILSPVSGTGLTNGAPVTVVVQLTTANGAGVVTGSVVLSYAWNNGSVITQAMTAVAGTNLYTVTLLPAVDTLSYSVSWQYTLNGSTNASGSSATANTVSSTLLDYVRYADFEVTNAAALDYAWVQTPGTTNWVYTIGGKSWTANQCRMPIPNVNNCPPGGTNRVIQLLSKQGGASSVQTPVLAEGVGTIYYTSLMSDPGYSAQMIIQVTTNSSPGNWQDVWTNNYNNYPGTPIAGVNTTNAIPIVLNNPAVRYVRFWRTDNGKNTSGNVPFNTTLGSIYLDNIYISRPPTGVTLGENLYNPGYPAQDQDVKVRCQVTDMDPTVPSLNRQVKVWYSWESESEPFVRQTNMVETAPGVYEGVIPRHSPGTMYYWFQCDFDGYFYSRDPDGAAGVQTTRNEKDGRSPASLKEKDDDAYRNYEIRRYRSDVEVMRVVCSNEPSASIDSMELVGNHVWQGLTLVSGITNLLWTFVGTNGYAENAEAFDTNVSSWGDNDQEFFYPPVGGYAERNATNSIKAELVYDGTLLIRMNETNGEYIIKRAVYQNFDVWPASQTDFEESFGLYAIQTYKQDFNTNLWGYGYDTYSTNRYDSESVDSTAVTDFTRGTPAWTWNFWAYDYARVVKERNVLTAARRAIELDGGLARGRVWNTAFKKEMLGTETFGFKARLSLNDRRFTYFIGTNGFDPFVATTNWPRGYWAETQFRAASLSPGLASCSVLTWFTTGARYTGSEYPSYYETRLTQVDPTAEGASQLQLALYRWQDGVGEQVAVVGTPTTLYAKDLKTDTIALRVQMPASGNTITARVGRVDGDPSTNIWEYTVAFSDSSLLTDMGTVGFGSYDAQPQISSIKVFAGTNTVNLLPGENWGAAGGLNSTNWYMGGKRADGTNRWGITENSLVRNIPSQTLALYTTPVGNNTWQPDDPRIKRNITNLVVSILDYTSFVVPLTVWDAHFVEIQNTATGEENAVVDDLNLSPWRAVTRSDKTTFGQEEKVGNDVSCYKWTSESQQVSWMNLIANKACWLIMEGWMNTSPGANKAGEAQFIRNRANSNLVQALVSPYLNNNIGSIAFDWRANGVSNVVFAIDRTYGEPPNANWAASPVLIVTNDALSGTVNLPIRGELLPGRLRIRICEGTTPNAEFKIDNLIVRDYPKKDVNTTWEAYNALITEAQPSRAYEPTLPGAQTAFLNNHPTNGVAKNERLDESQPYIQTPKVGTGIGEITFWYRVWDTNSSAEISLQVAKDEGGPWKPLTNIVVASTDTNYLFFSNATLYEPEYTILRIYGSTNAPFNRVCLDNVLMAESVRPSYVIQKVSLLPEQPLVGEGAGLKVDIGYFIMNPTNIRIYASTFIGTNTWGYTNWWSTAYTKIELTNSPGAPRVFQTPTNEFLPNTTNRAVDDVVQFFVWGDYGGIDTNHPIVLGTNAFVNPTWYFPADLNAVTPYQESGLPALGSLGWSPYYTVYSCPPGSVWVNELRYDPDGSAPNTEFIEIVGPAGAALGRWTLQMVDYNNEVMKTSVITNGFVLKPATNGWGFLLWGDPAMSIYGNDVLFDGWSDDLTDMPSVGGVRLIRSNGAWEDRVAWGGFSSEYGYTYAGVTESGLTLSLRSASTNRNWPKAGDFVWGTGDPTPYASNTDQSLLGSSEDPIIASIIYSAIGLHGAHSLGPNVVESVVIAPGGSTNIIYTANEWYRIGTMQTNGVTVGAALGAKVYTQALVNVQSSISNQVTFTNASSAQTGLTNRVEIHWVTNYYPTSEAAAVANTNIVRDYLLNISPTNSHTIAFSIDSIIASNKVTVTVKLADGVNALTNRINGVLRLYGKPTLNASNWSVIADATVSNASFNASGKYTLPAVSTSTNTFFKANIE